MLSLDRRPGDTRKQKAAYEKIRRSEYQYGIKLRKIARHVGEIVNGFKPADPESLRPIQHLLNGYAKLIEPWARATAASMLADVSRKDEEVWMRMTRESGLALREEIRRAPTGETLRRLQEEQVRLITSLPLEAAQRVHKLTIEGLSSAARYEEVKADILRTSHVTESRATMIARTEVGRAATNLTEARATHVGSEGYIWRTAGDNDVRRSHRAMEGRFVKWRSPPTIEKMTGHAGALPNCRCYPEVVIPEGYN